VLSRMDGFKTRGNGVGLRLHRCKKLATFICSQCPVQVTVIRHAAKLSIEINSLRPICHTGEMKTHFWSSLGRL